ncbi:TetR/AcrR family transcriptional regulator [Asticcacaulis sp. EMRT-3]|uniref:TetR/AcrR family transcriptional regulator n=1 Tax=Asticcacaulis sp. EMRT-3 TaxID=3040349 RepID=UPI0024AFA78D|nr:TetR/AcrR family transcriptional regulator [Asticcacaulis sp. EMRT-3]MDI7776089.1 TetR/AcrR family transcriptional regulator [Asticcacaulis sp. EMRT-3]
MLNTASRDTASFKDQRRERIIQVARSVFFEVGYAGASMSMISSRLGGSKATLYAYFNSKEELFSAIIREGCQDMAAIFQAHIGTNDLRQSLTTMGQEMMSLILSDWGNRTMQLIIEESPRNPDLPKLFHDAIETSGKKTLRQLLQTAHDRGQIEAPDVDEAAGILKSLLFGDIHFKRLLNLCPAPEAQTLHHHIDRAIDVFMTYYGRAAEPARS